MKLLLSAAFVRDLRDAIHPDFVCRVLGSLVDDHGHFKADRNDHRYSGIADAWIRYASAGKTAFRVIYIRRADLVLLYRAGFHSVEENLPVPKPSDAAIELTDWAPHYEPPPSFLDLGLLLSTTKPTLLRTAIGQMFHVQHHEIVLISPFVDHALFNRMHFFGRFLDKAMEEDTLVSLITRLPDETSAQFYQSLEERGINVFFHKSLHSKLFLFDVDPVRQGARDSLLPRTAIVGSANLTESGICFAGEGGNEELCYRVPAYKFDEVRDYVNWVTRESVDFNTYKRSLRRF
jgi:hypothetical protein